MKDVFFLVLTAIVSSLCVQAQFVHTDNGVACSERGLKDVSTAEECSDAVSYAKTFNSKALYRRSQPWRTQPKGCHIWTTGAMYFNAHSIGEKHSTALSICKRDPCFQPGEKVEIIKTSKYYGHTSECATVQVNICSNTSKYFSLTFDGGYANQYRYIDLQACKEYTYGQGQACLGEEIGYETSLKSAQAKCTTNEECTCIDDYGCDGSYWSMYTGRPIVSSALEYCSWNKREICTPTITITSAGLAETHHSSKLGKYIVEGTSNGHISYKNAEGWYLYFGSISEWLISSEGYKGTDKGWIASNCGFDCPEDCTGSWSTYVDGGWKIDSTLAVIKGDDCRDTSESSQSCAYWINKNGCHDSWNKRHCKKSCNLCNK